MLDFIPADYLTNGDSHIDFNVTVQSYVSVEQRLKLCIEIYQSLKGVIQAFNSDILSYPILSYHILS